MFRTTVLLCSSFCFAVGIAGAQTNEQGVRINTEADVPVVSDLLVGPTRRVITLMPGDSKTVDVEIINRHGRTVGMKLHTEDFIADPENEGLPKLFTDNTDGPFPARAWINPEVKNLSLDHGQRAFVRVTVTVPKDAEPGDHMAALVVTPEMQSDKGAGFSIVSRVASLFIVHVPGDIVEQGDLSSLTVKRTWNWWLPVRMNATFVNQGTVFMMPQGTVQIRNIFGIQVDELPLNDWIVLRDSKRTKDFAWEPTFALGRYTATANLSAFSDNRELQVLKTSFWVIPLLPVLMILLAIFIVSFFVQYFFSRFEVRRKD